jgi:hypothetical protein
MFEWISDEKIFQFSEWQANPHHPAALESAADSINGVSIHGFLLRDGDAGSCVMFLVFSIEIEIESNLGI